MKKHSALIGLFAILVLASCQLAPPSYGRVILQLPADYAARYVGARDIAGDAAVVRVYLEQYGSFVQSEGGVDFTEYTIGSGRAINFELPPGEGYRILVSLGRVDPALGFGVDYYGATETFEVSAGVEKQLTIEAATSPLTVIAKGAGASVARVGSSAYASAGNALWMNGSPVVGFDNGGVSILSIDRGNNLENDTLLVNTNVGLRYFTDNILLPFISDDAGFGSGASLSGAVTYSATKRAVFYYRGGLDLGYGIFDGGTKTDGLNVMEALADPSTPAEVKTMLEGLQRDLVADVDYFYNITSASAFGYAVVGPWLVRVDTLLLNDLANVTLDSFMDRIISVAGGVPSSVAITPNGAELYVGVQEGIERGIYTATISNTATGELGDNTLVRIPGTEAPIVAVATSDNGYVAALDVSGNLLIVNPSGEVEIIPHYAGVPQGAKTLAFFAGGTMLAIAGTDTVINYQVSSLPQ